MRAKKTFHQRLENQAHSHAVTEDGAITLHIKPFLYMAEAKPRLPRKSSKNYQLTKDTRAYFQEVFAALAGPPTKERFFVEITVYTGSDRLGNADLDNYCKVLLDGVTSTQKVWIDDKQVDQIFIKRHTVKAAESWICLKIQKADATCAGVSR